MTSMWKELLVYHCGSWRKANRHLPELRKERACLIHQPPKGRHLVNLSRFSDQMGSGEDCMIWRRDTGVAWVIAIQIENLNLALSD